MGDLSKKIGQRIREIRELKGIKQCNLADMLEMEPSNLTRIENGYQFPKEENLSKIASCLGVEVKDLFDFSGGNTRGNMIDDIIINLEEMNFSDVEFFYNFVRLYALRKR